MADEAIELTEVQVLLDALGATPTDEEFVQLVRGYTAMAVAAAAAKLAMEGSGLPEEWTVGAGGGLSITQSAEDGAVGYFVSAYETADGVEVFAITDSEQATLFNVTSEGRVTVYPKASGGRLEFDGGGGAFTGAVLRVEGAAATIFRIDKDGNPVLCGIHAAPVDGDLVAGDCALWFDQTNGASKLKIKGKSADGTVVEGEVALS